MRRSKKPSLPSRRSFLCCVSALGGLLPLIPASAAARALVARAGPDNSSNPALLKHVSGVVKWFDVTKGFGFIIPDQGDHDILFFGEALRARGFPDPSWGDRVSCHIVKCPKVWVATRFTNLRRRPFFRMFHEPGDLQIIRATGPWQQATVKWFNRVCGFGFVNVDPAMPDIFVHRTALRRFGFSELRPGQKVYVRYGHGQKGLMATHLRRA